MTEQMTREELDELEKEMIEAFTALADADPGCPSPEELVPEIHTLISLARQGLDAGWRTDLENAPRTNLHTPIEKPRYIRLWNGHHAGVGYIHDDGDDVDFYSETGEPIEPPPTHWQPNTPPEGK